jgi:phage N-6-adenine-methyltransferase
MLAGFRAVNHPQQVGRNGADDRADDRGTDAAVFAVFAAEFDLDAAASPVNAKCGRYFTREQDGRVQPWAGRVWCNPPYSGLGDWVAKAWQEWPRCDRIVMLLPANRCEQRWWQEHIEPHRDRPGSPLSVRFLPGRMRFDRPGAVRDPRGDRPPFGCVLAIWS